MLLNAQPQELDHDTKICVDIAINDKVLPWVHEIKYLGLTFSDGLCLKVNVLPNKGCILS